MRKPRSSLLLSALVFASLLILIPGKAHALASPSRLAVGIAMVPRGEVGLIFADIGLRIRVINEAAFRAVIVMALSTTYIAPIALEGLLAPAAEPAPQGAGEPT